MAGTAIVISILANASQANATLQQTATMTQKVGNGFRRMAAPAAIGLAAIGAAAYSSVQSASDLQESLSKNKVIFEGQSKEIENFAKNAATALGQSEVAALEASSTFGQIAQKAGLGGKASADFAKQFTTLSSDLASFNNTSPEEAIEAIGSAMRGEAEPIRRYGVLLDDATLRARALKLGLIETTSQALTPQQKALAASKEILAQTSKAQGDFARTSEGAANKQRIVAAQVENLKAKLGEALLPAFEQVLKIASKFANFLAQHTQVVQVLVGVMAALAVAILAVNAAMLLNPAVLIAAAIIALGAAVVIAYQRSETFRGVIQSIGQVFTGYVLPALRAVGTFIVGTLVPIFLRTAQAVGTALKPVLTQLAVTFKTQIQPALAQVAAKFQEWWPTIKKVITTVAELYGKLIVLQATIAGKVLPVLIRIVAFIVGTVAKAFADWVSHVASAVGSLINFGKKVVDAGQKVVDFAKKVGTKIGEVVTFFVNLPGQITSAIGDLGSLLFDKGVALVQGFIDGIGSMIQKAKDKLNELKDLLPGSPVKAGPLRVLNRASTLLKTHGRDLMQGFIDGVTGGSAGVEKALGAITDLIDKTFEKKLKRIKIDLSKKLDGKALKKALDKATEKLDKQHDRLLAKTKEVRKALLAQGKAIDANNEALKNARDHLQALKDESAQYAANIRDSFVAFGSLGSLGDGNGFANADQLIELLKKKVEQAKQYAALIKALMAAGLNQTAIQQLIDLGVEGGLGTAQAILEGGPEAIAQINALQAQLAATGLDLGTSTANTMYGAGIQAAQGLVDGLAANADVLAKQATKLAKALVRAVKKALGISSPSKVFRDLGKNTVKGLVLGLDEVHVRRQGAALASSLERGFGTPALAAFMDVNSSSDQKMTIDLRLSADQVDQLSRGRAVAADLDAWYGVGGRVRS